MVSKPLVSVLINNYNKEKYCNRAIKSILNQSYKNIEIIFFDDGSTDNSVNKIKKSFSKNLDKIKIIKNRFYKGSFLNKQNHFYFLAKNIKS